MPTQRAPHAPCTIEGCAGCNYSNGLCRSHYYKQRRADAAALRSPREQRLCIVEGCDEPHFSNDWCQRHYFQHRRKPHLTMARGDLQQHFPSVAWGIREWQLVLLVRGDILDHLLDDMYRHSA